MNRTIEITVAKDGQTRVETKGFVGAECRDASRYLEQALGLQLDELLKPGFHQSESVQQQIRSGS
ncbi:DUF2997 domain-containing protein [Blastopirellula sp. J2-11]|uniref:DUF2997 domain-containing protein n=1 Tax=Blastopirellula sp. J2-11 TaxID=2943192 RepID=UPI0021C6A585|nr:DUF2997 domain-containing protein [Blastopirellula sp. J2-11]UUO07883.1 DUF2997 domain-containing protein [Blastopirellula sp. J2-11]